MKVIKRKSPVQLWLLVAILFCLLPFYFFFHALYHKEVPSASFLEYREAANELRLVGLFSASAELFWRYYATLSDPKERLSILDQLRMSLEKGDGSSRNMQERLSVLYLIQALDPQEKQLRYRFEIHSILQKLGKNRDAANYLQANASLQKTAPSTNSGALVIARYADQELLLSEVEDILQGNMEEKKHRLSEYIAKKLLIKESLPLMTEPDFQAKLQQMTEEFRLSFYVEQKLKRPAPTELELQNHFLAHQKLWNYPVGYRVSCLLLNAEKGSEFSQSQQDNPRLTRREFNDFVKKNSLAPYKEQGGDIKDWIETDSVPQIGFLTGLTSLLANTEISAVSPALKTEQGWYYFFVQEKRAARKADFSELQKEVQEHYLNAYRSSFLDGFWAELFQKNNVVINYERL